MQVVAQEDITVISNTGDDEDFFGLRVSPDIDIVIYTLAGAINAETGWGLAGETFHALEALGRFGYETWFGLGDGDLATHVHRTKMLRDGATLSEATRSIVEAFGLRLTLLPVSDDRIRTMVETAGGETLAFQEYFVKRRTEDEVRAVRFDGIDAARPAPGVLEAIAGADVIAIAPSNPVVSIGPLLAVRGVRDALRETRGERRRRQPDHRRQDDQGAGGPDDGVAGHDADGGRRGGGVRDFLDVLVIDEEDRALAPAVEAAGVRAVVAQTIMRGPAEKRALAEVVVAAGGDYQRMSEPASEGLTFYLIDRAGELVASEPSVTVPLLTLVDPSKPLPPPIDQMIRPSFQSSRKLGAS